MLSLGLLYTFQDKMLYLPGSPIRNIRDNPRGYRSPNERSITYQNIRLEVPDSEQDSIHGWHMYHENSETDTAQNPDGSERNTVIFFHENAGNLGLRMDYFSMLYHEMGFNVLSFAYRGYSDSVLKIGSPNEDVLKQDARVIVDYCK